MTATHLAPGGPGAQPHWTAGAKTGVGTATSPHSCVWFTLGNGTLNEVFYPFADIACVRELELIITAGKEFMSTEKWDANHQTNYLADGVPAFHLTNTCKQNRYRIEKTILADPNRSAILQKIEFVPLKGRLTDYQVYVLLSPHIGNQGEANSGWLGDFKGLGMLFASRGDTAMGLACSQPWAKRSVGFAESSDIREDLKQHGTMTWEFDRANNGNVVLAGQVDLAATNGKFELVLGFGRDEAEAGHRARASMLQGFDSARELYLNEWNNWQKTLAPIENGLKHKKDLYRTSAAVMRTHESKAFPGAIVASLAIPWGAAHGDDDLGYHLVWPRDMIETVGALCATGAHEDVRRILRYFAVTQDADGHWPQNMFLDGKANWNGIQLDETALVIVLVELAQRSNALGREHLEKLWPMVRRAARYLIRNGPVTPMDRWEEEAGYFVSTTPVEVAALLAAAVLAEQAGEREMTRYLRETADAWNQEIDGMLYVAGTELARRAGVDGYYVRMAKPDQRAASKPAEGEIQLKNHKKGQGIIAIENLVSVDALMLVRMGLRAADDPRIVNTIKVIDMLLKVETPNGPCWHRYNEDGYGEHADGSPFDDTGIGRVWPLLAGEAAHYELAAGNKKESERILLAIESFANECGLLPEQIWDSPDIPEKGLYFGRPSGSAMPLVWAHAEYVKLRRSLHDGRVYDTPPLTVKRYITDKTLSPHVYWRLDQPCRSLPRGKMLRVELFAPAMVRWTVDNWKSAHDSNTNDTGLGVHLLDLPTIKAKSGTEIVFTFQYLEDGRWEGKNFSVLVA